MVFIEEARRGFDLSGDLVPRGSRSSPAAILAPINAFVLFGVLEGAALWYRRCPQVHKRVMLLAMLGGLCPAPIAHLVGHWATLRPRGRPFTIVSVFGLRSLSALHDRRTHGRIHPVSMWGGLAVFVWLNFFFGVFAQTATWRNLADWLISCANPSIRPGVIAAPRDLCASEGPPRGLQNCDWQLRSSHSDAGCQTTPLL